MTSGQLMSVTDALVSTKSEGTAGEEEDLVVDVAGGVVGEEEGMMMTEDLATWVGEAEVVDLVAAGAVEGALVHHLRLDGIGRLPWPLLEVHVPHRGDSVLRLDRGKHQFHVLLLDLRHLEGGHLDVVLQ